jgi:CheY-like chemotaxis protein
VASGTEIAPQPDRLDDQLPPHQILVVDDDDDIREGVVDYLQEQGYVAVGAVNGRDALDQLKSPALRPCIMVIDLMMPVMDGRTFREEQLRTPSLSAIPVVVISANVDLETRAASLKAVSYLPKPLDLAALLAVVRSRCLSGQTPD